MSHHEILDAQAKGTSVILCEHTNTERYHPLVIASLKFGNNCMLFFASSRGYLPKLKTRMEEKLQGKSVMVDVSLTDADPLVVL